MNPITKTLIAGVGGALLLNTMYFTFIKLEHTPDTGCQFIQDSILRDYKSTELSDRIDSKLRTPAEVLYHSLYCSD